MDTSYPETDIQEQPDERYTVDLGDSEAVFIQKARDLYQKDVDADRHNIEPAREDIQFTIGDQWDHDTKLRRDRLKKPVLTVNRLPAFVAQYLGSWQQSDQSMKLIPMKGGTKTIAEIRQGVIRTILKSPMAKHALYSAMETAYISGIGNFGVELVENKFDVFVKDIQLVAYDDPFQIIWDRSSREPSGSDAQHCFATRYLSKDDFELRFPDAPSNDRGWQGDELDYTVMTGHGWEVDEMIRICYFWQMREEPVTLGLEADSGDVVNVTDWTEDQKRQALAVDNLTGELIVRDTVHPYAECHILGGGNEILGGPYRMNISRLPVFRVEGWALQEASVRFRWGFVRNAKDPQRIHNYWRSVLAEELQKSVSSKWLLDQTAVKSGLADHFRNSHLSGDNVVFWDSQSDGAKPEFIPPPMMNQAVLTEAQMSVQDIKEVTNKHEASMGVTSNEVSGKAITARQRVSELGDRIYLENMNIAQWEAAKVIDELIPEVYDTNRIVKLTGNDDQVLMQEINGLYDDQTPDITTGKYDITYTTGPSYATKREEAVDTMMTMMNHMPQTAGYMADILARNMDIPGSEEMAERFMSLLPPGMADLERLPERARLRLEAQQKQAQDQQSKDQQLQMMMMKKQFEELAAKIQELQSRAVKQAAQAELYESQTGVDAKKVEVQHKLGQGANMIDAAEAGIKLQGQEIDVARLHLDKEKADKEAANKAKEGVQNGTQNREEGNG